MHYISIIKTNSVDPDQMPHSEASDLGVHVHLGPTDWTLGQAQKGLHVWVWICQVLKTPQWRVLNGECSYDNSKKQSQLLFSRTDKEGIWW